MADKDVIRKEYETGKYTYQKIADKFNVNVNTVKSWAKRDRDEGSPWIKNNKKKVATKERKLQPTNKVATKKNESGTKKKKVYEKVVEEVTENEKLTDEQQLFCIYYIKCFNATKAYQKAYGCSYLSANSHGYKLLSNVVVREQIKELKQGKLNRVLLSEDDIFQKYIDIAFSDITDYVDYGAYKVPLIDKTTNEQAIDENGDLVFYKSNYINFKDSKDVDGSLISEVTQGKDGAKMKLQNKMKALQWLTDHMDLLSTANKEKLQLERDKLGANEEGQEPQDWSKAIIEIAKKRREKNERNK